MTISRNLLSGAAALTLCLSAPLAGLAAFTGAADAAAAPTSLAAATPVLGSPHHLAPNGSGWGTALPTSVDNGGDPAGIASHLVWKRWGAAHPVAAGTTSGFRPHGGYYRRPVAILLQARHLGTCADGTHAYTRLFYRIAPRPGAAVEASWHPWAGDGNVCSRY